MNLNVRSRRCAAPYVVVAVLSLSSATGRGLHAAPPNPASDEIAATISTFVRAFNDKDTVALSVVWSNKCVYRSAATGKEHTGRQAVASAYAAAFKEDPNGTLSLRVESLKFDSASKATLVAIATVKHDELLSTRTRIAAQLVRYGTGWLLERIDEVDLPPTAEQGLASLKWLVGTWSGDSPTGRTLNQFQWAPGNAFLVRTYWVEGRAPMKADGPSNQGTQYLGWDAQRRSIATWVFDSLGTTGQGGWQSDGPARWVNQLELQLPDGRKGSLTHVLVKLGDNKITLQLIDCQIDGVARPDGPVVMMVREPGNSIRPPLASISTP